MRCTLCDKTIKDYDVGFHHIELDANHTADICEGCADKLVKWQQKRLSRLFPTSAAKRRFG